MLVITIHFYQFQERLMHKYFAILKLTYLDVEEKKRIHNIFKH